MSVDAPGFLKQEVSRLQNKLKEESRQADLHCEAENEYYRLLQSAREEIKRLKEVDFTPTVVGALKSTIQAHGPITEQWIGSAAKRIVHGLRHLRGGQ